MFFLFFGLKLWRWKRNSWCALRSYEADCSCCLCFQFAEALQLCAARIHIHFLTKYKIPSLIHSKRKPTADNETEASFKYLIDQFLLSEIIIFVKELTRMWRLSGKYINFVNKNGFNRFYRLFYCRVLWQHFIFISQQSAASLMRCDKVHVEHSSTRALEMLMPQHHKLQLL